MVPQNMRRYRRGVAQTDIVITGFSCTLFPYSARTTVHFPFDMQRETVSRLQFICATCPVPYSESSTDIALCDLQTAASRLQSVPAQFHFSLF